MPLNLDIGGKLGMVTKLDFFLRIDKIRFWADTWLGTFPLAVKFWSMYTIYNEQSKCISDIWDGHQLKLSFGRNFSDRLMEQWF